MNMSIITGNSRYWISPLLIASFLTIGAAGLRSQSTAPLPAVKPSAQQLAAQRLSIEEQLESQEALGIKPEDKKLRPLQEQLLSVAEAEGLARQQQPAAAKALNSQTNIVSIPVYFLTDRVKEGTTFTATSRKKGLEYGIAETTLGFSSPVRLDRIAGAAAQSKGTKPTDPRLRSIGSENDLLASLTRDSAGTGANERRRIMLFVHGYNTSFADAANSAARLAVGMQFPVVPVVYSWPSKATYLGYWHDEDTVLASFVTFKAFLQTLLSHNDFEVVIICHSMGARVVTAALSELGRNSAPLPALRQVVYAAGDISVDQFDKDWPGLLKLTTAKFGFYASDLDVPLHLSHFLHSFQRLGDASPDVHAPIGGDSMDASSVDSVLQGLGHSYIIESPRISADISQWIETGDGPLKRDLIEKSGKDGKYYLFR
jgi:esterase/lipase superfamily enzyme